MKLNNLSNTFTIFGSFAPFDEDNILLINKAFYGSNIAIKDDPQSRDNRSGKVMEIQDAKRKLTIALRPNRIDIVLPGMENFDQDFILEKEKETASILASIFEGCDAYRLAVVINEFVMDPNKLNMGLIADGIDIISPDEHLSEFHLRYNAPCVVAGEECNNVLTVRDVEISNQKVPQAPKVKSMLFTFDVNTLQTNLVERFALNELSDIFKEMLVFAKDKLDNKFKDIIPYQG